MLIDYLYFYIMKTSINSMYNQYNVEELIQWIDKHTIEPITCPVCREKAWELNDQLWELRRFNKSGIFSGGPIIPLAILTCTNCGYTIQFNAKKIGLISSDNVKQPFTEK